MLRFTLNPLVIPTLIALLGALVYYYNPSSTLLAPLVSRQEWHQTPKSSVPTVPPILPKADINFGERVQKGSGLNGADKIGGDDEKVEEVNVHRRQRTLPSPGEGDERGESLSNGESVQLEKLGPVVVNQDGVSLSRGMVTRHTC